MVMPIYTVAILVFFIYTIVKILFKNKDKDKEEEDEDEEFLNSEYYKNHLAQQKAAQKKNAMKNIEDDEKVKRDDSKEPRRQKETCDKTQSEEVKPEKTNVVRFKLDEEMEGDSDRKEEKPDGEEKAAEVKVKKEVSSPTVNTPPIPDPSTVFRQIFFSRNT